MNSRILLTFVMMDNSEFQVPCNDYEILEEPYNNGFFVVRLIYNRGSILVSSEISAPLSKFKQLRVC